MLSVDIIGTTAFYTICCHVAVGTKQYSRFQILVNTPFRRCLADNDRGAPNVLREECSDVTSAANRSPDITRAWITSEARQFVFRWRSAEIFAFRNRCIFEQGSMCFTRDEVVFESLIKFNDITYDRTICADGLESLFEDCIVAFTIFSYDQFDEVLSARKVKLWGVHWVQ